MYRLWPLNDANWVEAAGTWFSAALSAAILVVLAIRSERVTHRLEAARQASERELEAKGQAGERELEAMRQARDDEEARQREQVEADKVECNAWPTSSYEEDGMRATRNVVVTVINRSGGVLSELKCETPFEGIRLLDLRASLGPGDAIPQINLPEPSEPIRFRAEDEMRKLVIFMFWLNGVWWSRCPAERQAKRKPML